MTLQEICVLTLRQLNEDEDALDELRDQLYNDINEGLHDLYTVFPTWQRLITLDSESGFVVSESGAVRLVKLTLDGGGQLFWSDAGGRVTVLRQRTWDKDKSVSGASVVATFRPLPTVLDSNSDVPDIPDNFHRALADYATFRMLGTGTLARQNRATHFYERFLRARANLSAWVNGRDRIVNKFS